MKNTAQIGLNYVPPESAPRVKAPDWFNDEILKSDEHLARALYKDGVYPADEQNMGVGWMRAIGKLDQLYQAQFCAALKVGLGEKSPRQQRLLKDIPAKPFAASVLSHIRYNSGDPQIWAWRVSFCLAAYEADRPDLVRAMYATEIQEFDWPITEGPQPCYLTRSGQRQVIIGQLCEGLVRPETTAKEKALEGLLGNFVSLQMICNEAVALAMPSPAGRLDNTLVDLLRRRRDRLTIECLVKTTELTRKEIGILGMSLPPALEMRYEAMRKIV